MDTSFVAKDPRITLDRGLGYKRVEPQPQFIRIKTLSEILGSDGD